jgi:hypothetical protein
MKQAWPPRFIFRPISDCVNGIEDTPLICSALSKRPMGASSGYWRNAAPAPAESFGLIVFRMSGKYRTTLSGKGGLPPSQANWTSESPNPFAAPLAFRPPPAA